MTKLTYHLIREELWKRWEPLCVRHGAAVQAIELGFRIFLYHHDEPIRKHHSLGHILHVWTELEEYDYAHSESDDGRLFAAGTHDIIYDPRSARNELDSAEVTQYLWKHVLKFRSSSRRAVSMVKYSTHAANNPPKDHWPFLDADLAILGAPVDEFDLYETGIREEYAHVSESLFRPGRAGILKTFLKRPFIYYTDHFQHKYERQARLNLARSITALEGDPL